MAPPAWRQPWSWPLPLSPSVLAAVHHAEVLAARVGEPFGAILLALAVTVIELGLIVSIMLGDRPEPTLLRDTIHAVVVLVLHGVAGLCIVVGAIRHREQKFRTQGAQAYLIVLLPMVAITLVLPTFTTSAPGPYYTNGQLAFVSAACLVLWLAFTFVQTVRHRDHFTPTRPGGVPGLAARQADCRRRHRDVADRARGGGAARQGSVALHPGRGRGHLARRPRSSA